jgi:hypothetical protein
MAYPPGTTVWVAGQRLDAADLNDWMQNLPWGYVDEARRTSDVGTFTTEQDMTGLTVTFTAPADRRYRIDAEAQFASSVGTDLIRMEICNGADVELRGGNVVPGAANSAVMLSLSHTDAPSAGSVTYKIRAARASGTGNVTLVATTDRYSMIRVVDVGPA